MAGPCYGKTSNVKSCLAVYAGAPDKEAHTALELDPNNPRTLAEVGYVLGVAGQTEEARKLLVTLEGMVRHGSAYSTFPAFVQIGLGQQDEALGTLEKIANSKAGFRAFYRQNPRLSLPRI